MRELDSIIQEILDKKPEISKESILRLIKEKKERIGSGYLTDTGAAYLVAADLELILNFKPPPSLEVRDLYIGANQVNLNCRVCSVLGLRSYIKRDGTEGHFLQMIVFDKTGMVRCILWDSKAEEVSKLDLKPDDYIRIKKASVKSDFNNFPSLHLGQRGSVELIRNGDITPQLPTLKEVSIPLDDFSPKARIFCIKAIVNSPSSISTFSRKDGSQCNILSFIIRGLKKNVKNRIVLWLSPEISKEIPRIGSLIVMGPLKVKPQSTGEIEFHGNDGTVIITLSEGVESGGSYKKDSFITLRLLSIGSAHETKKGSSSIHVLTVDESGDPFTLIGMNEVVPFLLSMKVGDVVEGSFAFLDKDKLICSDVNKISKKINVEKYELSKLYQKISEIKAAIGSKFYFVKAIAISQSTQTEVTSRNGERIMFSEILIGDETDEIYLIAWRNLSQLIDKIKPGERLTINGVILKTSPTMALEARAFSSITRLSE
jgi:hypothetical protein